MNPAAWFMAGDGIPSLKNHRSGDSVDKKISRIVHYSARGGGRRLSDLAVFTRFRKSRRSAHIDIHVDHDFPRRSAQR